MPLVRLQCTLDAYCSTQQKQAIAIADANMYIMMLPLMNRRMDIRRCLCCSCPRL